MVGFSAQTEPDPSSFIDVHDFVEIVFAFYVRSLFSGSPRILSMSPDATWKGSEAAGSGLKTAESACKAARGASDASRLVLEGSRPEMGKFRISKFYIQCLFTGISEIPEIREFGSLKIRIFGISGNP